MGVDLFNRLLELFRLLAPPATYDYFDRLLPKAGPVAYVIGSEWDISREAKLAIAVIFLFWWTLQQRSKRQKENKEFRTEVFAAAGITPDFVEKSMREKSRYADDETVKRIKSLVEMLAGLSPQARKELQMSFSPEFAAGARGALSLEIEAIRKQLEIFRDYELKHVAMVTARKFFQDQLAEVDIVFGELEKRAKNLGYTPAVLRSLKATVTSTLTAGWQQAMQGQEVEYQKTVIMSPVEDIRTLLSLPDKELIDQLREAKKLRASLNLPPELEEGEDLDEDLGNNSAGTNGKTSPNGKAHTNGKYPPNEPSYGSRRF